MKLINGIGNIFYRFFAEDFYDLCAQMAYYFMLSMIPFLIFMFSVIGFLPFNADNVLMMIEPFAPANTYGIIHHTLHSILDEGQGQWLPISFIATFWLASMAVQSLVRSLNYAYRFKRQEPFIHALLNDLFLTFGFMIILSLSLFVPIVERIAHTFVMSQMDVPGFWFKMWNMIKWGMGTGFLFIFFLFLYKIVPSIKLAWIKVIPGALFATLGWQWVSVIFSYYVNLGNYSKFYGQLGSIIVLMTWFYLTAVVLLTGGLINAEIYHKNSERFTN
ncbi:YihY/virulence factor BrkB family protein [Bacillus songklensis]|uniref:YihY/virulence factor BrkB family protein n=1 Tax=Bacillus songklensis TaxID=1069116 RepID=A0ABV8B4V6_9BACI